MPASPMLLHQDFFYPQDELTPVSEDTVYSAFSESMENHYEEEFVAKKGNKEKYNIEETKVEVPRRGSKSGISRSNRPSLVLLELPSSPINLSSTDMSFSKDGKEEYQNARQDEFFRACRYGLVDSAQASLAKGRAAIDARDSADNTALHLGVASGRLDLVKLLLRFGANLAVKNKAGETPLDLAESKSVRDLLDDYEKRLNAISQSENHLKAFDGRLDDEEFDVYAKYNFSQSLLHAAVMGDRHEVVETLLGRGANVNEKNSDGSTAIHEACRFSSLKCLKILLEKSDSALKIVDRRGQLPIDLADKAAKRMIQKHRKTREATNPPLEIVTIKRRGPGRPRKSETLIKELIPVIDEKEDKKDSLKIDKSSGRTELHRAVARGNSTLAESLLDFDQTSSRLVNWKDNGGYTALHAAALRLHLPLIKMLIERGAHLDAQADNGDTPLHDALEAPDASSKESVIKFLIGAGANLRLRNRAGKRALDYEMVQIYLPHLGLGPLEERISPKKEKEIKKRKLPSPVKTGTFEALFSDERKKKAVRSSVIEVLSKDPLVQIFCSADDDGDHGAGWYFLAGQMEELFYSSFPNSSKGKLREQIPASRIRTLSYDENERLCRSSLMEKLSSMLSLLSPVDETTVLYEKDSVLGAFEKYGASLASIPVMYIDLERLSRKSASVEKLSKSPKMAIGSLIEEEDEEGPLPPKLKLKQIRKGSLNENN